MPLVHVPMATAQKLMRHSDPRLTAKVYTHVMVDTKAEALDMLPTIVPIVTTEKEAATGTHDPAPEPGKIIVMPVDSFRTDSTANIKTYGDFCGAMNDGEMGTSKHEKALSPKGKQGDLIWRHDGTRTRNLQIDSLTAGNHNSSNNNALCKSENEPDTLRDTFISMSGMNEVKVPITGLLADLVPIMASWPSIPDPIKEAVKAVLAPYLSTKG